MNRLGIAAAWSSALMSAAVVLAAPPNATDVDAQRVVAAYEAARPPDRDLGVFALDWAPSLKEARERAAKEKRPIFFVGTMQLKDAGDLQGGHC